MSAAQPVVWHLLSNRWNSAITEYCLSLARAFELLGWKSVLTAKSSVPGYQRAVANGHAVESIPEFSLKHLGHLRRLQGRIRPQLIVCYGGVETVLTRALNPCAIIRFRGQDYETGVIFKRLRHFLAHQHVSLILTPSRSLAEQTRRIALQPVASLTLGCDEKNFFYHEQPLSRDLTIFGRFDPVKGHRAFMHIFSQVLGLWTPDDGPTPRLRIIGQEANLSTEKMAEYAATAFLRSGIDVVIENRRVENVAHLMSETAVGVIPSLGSEIICRVAEEFLLCGAPVLVSGVGSLKEVLIERDAGLNYGSFPSDEIPLQIKGFIKAALRESSVERKKRATCAYENFSLEAMARSLALILKQYQLSAE